MENYETIVLADSIAQGTRLTTLMVRFPMRYLTHMNTHRKFSRNTRSMRAIKAEYFIEEVLSDPYIPEKWYHEKVGMQGPEITDPVIINSLRMQWCYLRDDAVFRAREFMKLNIHHEHINSILAPWLWTEQIISSTEWENYLLQRDHPDSVYPMQLTAQSIRRALEDSTPKLVLEGNYHLPLIREDDRELPLKTQLKLSAARCARKSYDRESSVMERERDLRVYQQLVSADPPHMSPFEHQAVIVPDEDYLRSNFDPPWLQQRQIVEEALAYRS